MQILIIEDNENNMELITFILETGGYQVLKAENGKDGIELALQERPNCILLDIQLPDIMGTEVLDIIRKSEIGVSIPIVAVTSYAMIGDKERLLATGCNGYIEKPIDPMLFLRQIKKIIGVN